MPIKPLIAMNIRSRPSVGTRIGPSTAKRYERGRVNPSHKIVAHRSGAPDLRTRQNRRADLANKMMQDFKRQIAEKIQA